MDYMGPSMLLDSALTLSLNFAHLISFASVLLMLIGLIIQNNARKNQVRALTEKKIDRKADITYVDKTVSESECRTNIKIENIKEENEKEYNRMDENFKLVFKKIDELMKHLAKMR